MFNPVRTKADLDSLNSADILEGYASAERGDPEPGENRGRAFWHGWRNRMIDLGVLPSDDAARQLAHEVVMAARVQKWLDDPEFKADLCRSHAEAMRQRDLQKSEKT